jgi:hypothetical protein
MLVTCDPEAADDQQPDLQCVKGECHRCGVAALDDLDVFSNPAIISSRVTWHQWENKTSLNPDGSTGASRVERVAYSGTVEEYKEALKRRIRLYVGHHHCWKWQANAMQQCLLNLSDDTTAMAMDFAENATLKEAVEVQSQHWSQTQATMLCVVTWRVVRTDTGR